MSRAMKRGGSKVEVFDRKRSLASHGCFVKLQAAEECANHDWGSAGCTHIGEEGLEPITYARKVRGNGRRRDIVAYVDKIGRKGVRCGRNGEMVSFAKGKI